MAIAADERSGRRGANVFAAEVQWNVNNVRKIFHRKVERVSQKAEKLLAFW